jgi:hypothetical protein
MGQSGAGGGVPSACKLKLTQTNKQIINNKINNKIKDKIKIMAKLTGRTGWMWCRKTS